MVVYLENVRTFLLTWEHYYSYSIKSFTIPWSKWFHCQPSQVQKRHPGNWLAWILVQLVSSLGRRKYLVSYRCNTPEIPCHCMDFLVLQIIIAVFGLNVYTSQHHCPVCMANLPSNRYTRWIRLSSGWMHLWLANTFSLTQITTKFFTFTLTLSTTKLVPILS